ncbi:MAG: CoB--CoM heterodisulfide reductase iron-sulfur subunit B family protein [candidate division Zixibacteria bacterium]|nr:CoB--CoM heterodisulfide reductase iron-sulfur subunit B family protein [candidate division Zixibacteria bacterium]MBU1469240.1 CoB--CoM heterodisulfide reductase iron-sulfur subunit B family protein [candidate division Zixibacteria bacterium]MBU2624304.1 CoB--CoM heterodisulfide reductase iron-sulfur subunit B family protein [candidate division Zixibacteria bacterium]
MKVSYYPGCTLKTKAKNLEKSALAVFDALGIDWEELPRWNCCGAVFSLADDDLIHMVAPVRDLVRAKELDSDTVVTLCSMCYNTLARANELMKADEAKRNTINDFMDEEPDYFGDLKVVHFLDFLRDEIGWDKLKEKIKSPLNGLKVAPYYGCTLLRPEDVAIDHPDSPTIFGEFMDALGAEVIEFPSSTVCCGSYQVLVNPDAALKVSFDILSDAVSRGADALVLTCPLCDYNLGRRQDAMLQKYEGATDVPVLYFTQLLAVALGLPADVCHFELNRSSTVELLKNRNLIATA